VKSKLPRAVAIFVLPPSRADLERRIRGRGTDAEEEIRRRLEQARQEILNYNRYDFVVINDDLERAGQEVQQIALASRCRVSRNEDRIHEILMSFGG
jgi:guanylate kinase